VSVGIEEFNTRPFVLCLSGGIITEDLCAGTEFQYGQVNDSFFSLNSRAGHWRAFMT
jgi:hypothetical protein